MDILRAVKKIFHSWNHLFGQESFAIFYANIAQHEQIDMQTRTNCEKRLKKRSGHPPHNGVKIFLKLYMNFYLNFHISAHSVLIGTKKLLLQSESSITIWSTVAKIKISDPSHIISFLLSSSVFLTVHRELTRLRKLTFKVEASLYFFK